MESIYIKLNNTEIPLEDLANKLGFTEPIQTAAICQKVPAGVLRATATGMITDPYPGIDVELVLPKEAESVPIQIMRAEQPNPNDMPEDVTAFLYGRCESYIAYMHVDTRPDAEEEAHPNMPTIIASGDPGEIVRILMENEYVHVEEL